MKHRKRHPEQPDGWVCIARLRLLNRRFDEARALYRRETRTYTDFTFAAEMAAQVEFFGRDFAEAEKLYTQLYEQDPLGGGNFYAAVSYASALGRIKMETDPAAGRELLEQARKAELEIVGSNDQDPAPFYRLAATEASLGLTDAALAHLRAAAEAGWIDYRSLGIDPRFDSLRDDPVYARLIEQMSARVASLRNAVLAKGELNLIP
jgi:tetratricopeptide (TPR) repeat protein